MCARDLARCTIMVLAMLVVLASDSVRSDPGIIYLIHVHGPDDKQEIEVNVAEISSLRMPRADSGYHFAEGVRCLVYMNSGQFIATHETCHDVVKKIDALSAVNPEKHP